MNNTLIKLPFYYESTKTNDNGGFPLVFPFKFKLDKKLGMLHQISTKALSDLLEKAYLEGSMLAGGMNDLIIGSTRSDFAIDFIKKNFAFKKNSKVLEIGCGEGQIIEELSKEKVMCVGLEPGPQVLNISNKNIKIVKDFFPSKKINEKFDLILHFGVMEHIENPVKFLRDQKRILKKDGVIICGIPDSEPYLQIGDISMLAHEHFNYFTRYNIANVSQKAGLLLKDVTNNIISGGLLVKFVNSSFIEKSNYDSFLEKMFIKKIKIFENKVINFFKNVDESSVAVYCPIRSINLLYLAGISKCRLADDNPSLQHRFLPTFKNKIEGLEDLKKNPPKKLLIYSRTFGELIKKKCLKVKELNDTEIKTINDLIS